MPEKSKKRLRFGGDNEDLLVDSLKERIWGETTTAVAEEKPTEKKAPSLSDQTDEQLEGLIDAVFTEQERRKDA